MTTLALNRLDEKHAGEKWQIKLEDRSALLLMPDGQVAASFTPEEAYPQFEFIRFDTKLGNNIRITDGQNTWHFGMWPKVFKQIKAFVQQSPEASSGTALASLKRRVIILTILGSLILLGSVGLTLQGYFEVRGQEGGGEFMIYYGAMVVGSCLLFAGFYYFAELRKLRQSAS
jgi:hypothetical protein